MGLLSVAAIRGPGDHGMRGRQDLVFAAGNVLTLNT